MAYPASTDSFTANTDDVDDVLAADVNELQTAIVAIETELGTDPAGSVVDLKTRLAHSISDAGMLEFDQEALLTISSGAITVTQNLHRVDTEASAASDYLATINGGSNGMFLIIRANHTDRTVIVDHNAGNILCTGGQDITLDSTNELAFGYYDGTLSKWILARGLSGTTVVTGSGADGQVAVFSSASAIGSSDALDFDGDELTVKSDNAAILLDGTSYDWAVELDNTNGGADVSGYTRFTEGAQVKCSDDDVSDPPQDDELDGAFGTVANLGAGFVGILDDNSADTDVYICFTNDTSWWYIKGTKAVNP